MSHAVRSGEILAGKYAVEKVLGQGGMGVVVSAHHVQLGSRVAIKFLLPEAARHPEASARFLREARAAVQIQSEHVARVSDVGTLDNGAPYMVMEFLSGADLGKMLAARGSPFAVQEAVDYVLQACEAIAEAHSLGIVHRDLKPANLFLLRRADGSPLVKVLDFGISKIAQGHGADASITATATILGSPAYMSPEQVRSAKNVDTRTDIWSLGMILYEFLCGRRAFDADTISGLLAQIVADPPVSLNARRPDLPPRLGSVVMRCLEKDPARRIGDVAELARALLPFSPESKLSVDRVCGILNSTGGAHPIGVVDDESPSSFGAGRAGPRTVTAVGWGTTQLGNPRNRKWVLAAVFMGAVAGLGVTSYVLWPAVAGTLAESKAVESRPGVAVSSPSAAGFAETAEPRIPATSGKAPFNPPPAVVSTDLRVELPVDAVIRMTGTGRLPGGSSRQPTRQPRTSASGASPAGSARPAKDLFDDIH